MENFQEPTDKKQNSSHGIMRIVVSCLFIIALIGSYFLYHNYSGDQKGVDYKKAYLQSLKENNPTEIQNLFKKDVSGGINDKYTKSAAYFITHRYFDNKGDIYEIYTYAKSDPVLDFLNQAEVIYPEIFEKIKNNQLPKTYSEESTYAYLAYLEAIYKNGFGDVAMLGTAAGQYAKMAYISKNWPENEGKITEEARRNIEKSKAFIQGANQQVADILEKKQTIDSIYASDMVVGLNQYAYALRYMSYFGESVESLKTPEEIFAFSKEFTKVNAPELSEFSHLADASSLLMVDGPVQEITLDLNFIMKFDVVNNTPRDYSVVDRIIHAKEGREQFGMYSDGNIVALAKKVPDFKEWLKKAGWVDSDFE